MIIVPPDVEEALIEYLTDGLDDAGLGDIHVGTAIPNPRPDYFVVLRLAGGSNKFPILYTPTVVIDTWGTLESQTSTIARVVDGLIMGIDRVDDIQFYRVDVFSSLQNFPDPEIGSPRYRSNYSIRVRKHVY